MTSETVTISRTAIKEIIKKLDSVIEKLPEK